MGVVYEAYDAVRNETVALKTLRNTDARMIYRLKREFRALSGLVHPNLVTLHELFSVGDEWFFTMELIRGRSLRELLRPCNARSAPLSDDDDDDPTGPAIPSAVAPQRAKRRPPLPPGQLEEICRQVACGIDALHRYGRLHRDIKPSNVLVTDDGRALLCDFGLVAEIDNRDEYSTSEEQVIGTPVYMSPEHAAHEPVTESSDWYSFGIMLYEALTGEVPFSGDAAMIARRKQITDVAPPSSRAEEVPPHLDRLTVELLRSDPRMRPTGEEVLRRLGGTAATVDATDTHPTLIGRDDALATLRRAFDDAASGASVLVLVHGTSGVGKSALAREFLQRLEHDQLATTFSGRCYQNEQVPYKGIDSIIDAVSSHLLASSPAEVEQLLPPNIDALARLFPVLRRVEAVTAPATRQVSAPDPQVARRRAFEALRELVIRTAEKRPVVLCIDDVHWGDLDSAVLLSEVLRPPAPRRLLVIAAYRGDEITTSPFLQTLKSAIDGGAVGSDVRELALQLLPAEGAAALARTLLGHTADAETVARIAKSSGGHPLFVQELVAGARIGDDDAQHGSLEETVARRIAGLPASDRALLQALSVAGKPIALTLAAAAANVTAQIHPVIDKLRSQRLVRARLGDEIEIYHDRIREVILTGLAESERTELHRALATEMRKAGSTDIEALVAHLLVAGERAEARRYAMIAAERASEALAFDRAARFLRIAVDLTSKDDPSWGAAQFALGEALANAGRGPEAAICYADAARSADPELALEYRRRAAEQLLRSGHVDEGLVAIVEVLEAIGMKMPATPRAALLSLVWGRARMRLRGLGFVARAPAKVSRSQQTRIDACWSVATALGLIDNIFGAAFQVRHLKLALDAGDPYRIARGLAVETIYIGGGGGPNEARTMALVQRTRQLADDSKHPHAIGLAHACAGMAAFLLGRWREGKLECALASEVLGSRCAGVAWEHATTQLFALASRLYLGELGSVRDRVPELIREAEQRGDEYVATAARSWRTNLVWLVDDEPEQARQQVKLAMDRWTHSGFHMQHYYEMLSVGQIHLYAREADSAWQWIADRWPKLDRSLLLRVQNIRIEANWLRGRAALLAARESDRDRASTLRRIAASSAARLSRERMPWASALAELLRAGLEAATPEKSCAHLDAAERGFADAEMAIHAHAAKWCRGALVGGSEGATLQANAVAALAAERVRRPDRFIAMLAPGFPG